MTREGPVAGSAHSRHRPRLKLRPGPRSFRGATSPPGGHGSQLRPGGAGGSCLGAVTAEFAVALPAVILLLALLLAASAAGVTQLRLEDAARAGARALARGDSAADVDGIVRRLAGRTAGAAVAADGEWISLTVSGRVPGTIGALLPWTLSARAWARRESAQASGFVRAMVGERRQASEPGP